MRSTYKLPIFWLCRLKCVAVTLLWGPPDTLGPKMVQLGIRSCQSGDLWPLQAGQWAKQGVSVVCMQATFVYSVIPKIMRQLKNIACVGIYAAVMAYSRYQKKWCWNVSESQFLSPPVLMYVGLLCVAFCPSVRLYNLCQNTRKNVTRKKFLSQEPLDLWSPNFVWWWVWTISKLCVKLKVIGQRSRSPCWKTWFSHLIEKKSLEKKSYFRNRLT